MSRRRALGSAVLSPQEVDLLASIIAGASIAFTVVARSQAATRRAVDYDEMLIAFANALDELGTLAEPDGVGTVLIRTSRILMATESVEVAPPTRPSLAAG